MRLPGILFSLDHIYGVINWADIFLLCTSRVGRRILLSALFRLLREASCDILATRVRRSCNDLRDQGIDWHRIKKSFNQKSEWKLCMVKEYFTCSRQGSARKHELIWLINVADNVHCLNI